MHALIAVHSVVLLLVLIVGGLFVAGPSVRADWFALHGPAVIGIPAAILIATMVVSGACALDDEGSLAFPGSAIKGGGALVLGWLAVFAVIVLALRALW
jgi:hypothetical protein